MMNIIQINANKHRNYKGICTEHSTLGEDSWVKSWNMIWDEQIVLWKEYFRQR